MENTEKNTPRRSVTSLVAIVSRKGFIILTSLIAAALLIDGMGITALREFPVDFGPATYRAIDSSIDWMVVEFAWFFDSISNYIKVWLGALRSFFSWIPWPIVIIGMFYAGWKLTDIKVSSVASIALLFMGLFDLWESAMITVAIMTVSVSLSVGLGVPLGVMASRNNMVQAILRPILDTMQTMPSFCYLVPGIMFFGLGNVAAVLAVVLYAIPPCIRLTNLGIRQVDASVIEAGRAFGSTRFQLLTKVQIPLAIPTIMAGINQTVLMALAMSTIAAMVGAGGLGMDVLRSMGQLREGEAFISGAGIVILAMIFDRFTQGYIRKQQQTYK
tara:strand:+ start:364 stop:1353 length:990 start_codon:yes stop_codon:yes gene_type:complete